MVLLKPLKKFKTDVQYFEGFSVEKISLSLVFQVWILPSKSNKSVKNTCILTLKSLPKIQRFGKHVRHCQRRRKLFKRNLAHFDDVLLNNHTNVASVNLLDMLDEDREEPS